MCLDRCFESLYSYGRSRAARVAEKQVTKFSISSSELEHNLPRSLCACGISEWLRPRVFTVLGSCDGRLLALGARLYQRL